MPYTRIVIGSSVFHKLAVSLQAKSLSPHEKLPKELALRLRVVFRMSLDPFVVILFVCLFLVGRLFVKYFCILHFLFFFFLIWGYIYFSHFYLCGGHTSRVIGLFIYLQVMTFMYSSIYLHIHLPMPWVTIVLYSSIVYRPIHCFLHIVWARGSSVSGKEESVQVAPGLTTAVVGHTCTGRMRATWNAVTRCHGVH